MKEDVFFHKGLAFEARSAVLNPGCLRVANNIAFETDGDQTARIPFTALNSSALAAAVHTVKRYESLVFAAHGGTIASAPVSTGVFTTLGAIYTSAQPWQLREYKKFIHGVNGYEEVLFDEFGNLFPARIDNPATACSGAEGAAGNPSGSYRLYCSYHVTFPNGMTYETGLSPENEADVDVTSKKITWTIPVSTYAAQYIGEKYAFNSVKSLLHLTGAGGSTDIVDATGLRTWTASNASITTSVANHFNDDLGCLKMDTAAGYITTADHADLDPGSAGKTISFMYRPSAAVAAYGNPSSIEAGTPSLIHWGATSMEGVVASGDVLYVRGGDNDGKIVTVASVSGTAVSVTESLTSEVDCSDVLVYQIFGLVGRYEDADSFWYLATTGADIAIFVIADNGAESVTEVLSQTPSSAWVEFVIQKSTSTLKVHCIGATTQSTTITGSIPDLAGALTLGRCRRGASAYVPSMFAARGALSAVQAYFSEFRITNIDSATSIVAALPTYRYIAPAIKRRLYRGPGDTGTLADIYWVADVYDNTTTTYSDDWTDVSLAANGSCTVDDYGPLPHAKLIEYHYGIVNVVDRNYPWRIYYSEAATGDTSEDNESLLPLACLQESWDDLRTVGVEKVDIQALVSWGTNLYVGLRQAWIKRQGLDPETWTYRKTYAKHGVSATRTVSLSKLGIIYLTTNIANDIGLAIFDGQSSSVFTCPNIDYIFKNDFNPAYADQCVGVVAGQYYYFIYLDRTATPVWKLLVIDMRRYPDNRVAYWSKVCGSSGTARSIEAYSQGYDQTNLFSVLVGGSDGKVYKDTSTATAIPFELWTKDYVGQAAINSEKTWKELRYNINTGGEDVTLEIYIDGTVLSWADGTTSRSISGTSEAVKVIRDFPPNAKGKRISLRVYDTAGHTTMHIYSPWSLIYDVTE